MTIYHWPPVGLKSRPVWTEQSPTRRSVSALTGRRYVSAHQRPRLHAEFSVSARGMGAPKLPGYMSGAGYMDALARLVKGGEHLVRLYYRPPTPITDRVEAVRWYDDGPVTWYDPIYNSDTVVWYTGTPGEATLATDGGFPAVRITGLPASTRIAIPGEFARIGDETRMVIAEAWSDPNGTATVRIIEAFSGGGPITIGEPETAIFEPTRIPEGGGPLSAEYTYDWSFRQVFPDEIGGAQAEVSGWWGKTLASMARTVRPVYEAFKAYFSPSGAKPALVLDYVAGVYSLNGDASTSFDDAHTFTRASTATYRDSTGARRLAAVDQPRLDHDAAGNSLGLLIEEQRTNLFLNSDAPAGQTISLGTGDHTLWIEGAGSAAVAAGTAAGTGFGSATEGAPLVFNISTAGTVTVSITAPVTICQLEPGAFPTSYIPTAGASVTRSADVCSVAAADFAYNEATGSVVLHGRSAAGTASAQVFVQIDAGNAENRLILYRASANIQQFVRTSAVVQANIMLGGVANGAEFKVASAFATDDFSGSLNGSAAATDTAGSMPTGITGLRIGRDPNFGNPANGHIARIVYYPSRLADADLVSLST